MLRLIFALFFIGLTNAQLICNEGSMNKCQHQFANATKIPLDYDWNHPRDLMIALQDIYINTLDGKNGLVAVCNAFNGLIKCINGYNLDVDTCLSAAWLLHHDKSPDNAYQYAMLMKQIRWQCGAGFYPAYDNWEWIQKAYANSNKTLLQCIDSFRANANEAPASEKCTYAVTGMKCYRTPFYRQQPGNMAVANYGCESFRQYVLAEYPQCSTSYCEEQGF